MGSKPKKQGPSKADRANASVALAEHNYFKSTYDPLLRQMRDASNTDATRSNLRGRANADTMQTLAGKADYAAAASGQSGGDMAKAYQGQLGIANQSALDIQNKMSTSVLGTARGQAADAQSGMADASRMAESKALTKAAAKQKERAAKMAAVGQIATAAISRGAKNMQTQGTKGKTHVNDQGQTVPTIGADGKQVMETVNGSFFSAVDGQGNKQGFFGRASGSPYNPWGQ